MASMNQNAGSICSPALTLSVEALFGRVNPAIAELSKIGWTDFSNEAPEYAVKPGATLTIPIADTAMASEFGATFEDGTKNNYLHGGATSWVDLTAKHWLNGFDISGVDIDNGVNAQKMKNLFAIRAGDGIARSMLDQVKTYLNSFTATPVEVSGEGLSKFYALASAVDDASKCVLVMSGTVLAEIKGAFAEKNIVADNKELASFLGFKDISVIPGVGGDTFQIVAVPETCFGVIGRVPTLIANYMEKGTQTDEGTGFSIGICVADDQANNRQVVNADFWFGVVGTKLVKIAFASEEPTSDESGLV